MRVGALAAWIRRPTRALGDGGKKWSAQVGMLRRSTATAHVGLELIGRKVCAVCALIGAASIFCPSVALAEVELPTTDELVQAMASLCGLKPTEQAAEGWLHRRGTEDQELFKRMTLDPAWKAAEIERMLAKGHRFLAEVSPPTRLYEETKALNRWTLEDYSADRGGIVSGTGRTYRVACDAAADRLGSMGIFVRCDDTPLPADGRPLRNAPSHKAIISARYPGPLRTAGLVLPLAPDEAMRRFTTPARATEGIWFNTGADFTFRIDGCVTERTHIRPKTRLTATIVEAQHYLIGKRGMKRKATLVIVKDGEVLSTPIR